MNPPPQSMASLTLIELQDCAEIALRQWHSDTNATSPLAPLLLHKQLRQSELISEHEATNRILYQGLQLLEERYPQEAMILRRLELDNELGDFVANSLNISPATLFRWRKNALRHLSEVLMKLEEATHKNYRTRLLARLAAPSYTNLLGVEEHVERLSALLQKPGQPWIVALAGMGGIGKTSMADAVVRGMVERGDLQEVGWVTARQTVLQWNGPLQEVAEPALTLDALAEELCTQLLDERIVPSPNAPRNAVSLLRGILKARPHVVVVDNLETVSDIEALVMALRELSEPTKFLLTSRESLFTQPDIYHYAVPELAEADALALIRQEAVARNLVHLHAASDTDLRPVIELAGGNPLALRLIVGQTYIHPLAVVLENLAKARGVHIENLYTYIYHEAWRRLDEMTRQTLVVMPLVTAAGADLAHLAQISGIAPEQLVRSLENLVKLNLVDVRGDLHQRRYSIHNLTRTFLHEQVLHWK